jgi:hypothetical protein
MTEKEKLQRENDIVYLNDILVCYMDDCISGDISEQKEVKLLFSRIAKVYLPHD